VPKIHGVNHQDAVRALQKAGFRVIRRGKHIVMTDGVRILTAPRYNPVNAYTIDRPILNPLEISRRKFPTGQLSLRLDQLRWPKLVADDIGVGCDYLASLVHRSGGYPISTIVPLLTRRWLVARSTITRATCSSCRSEQGSASWKMS